MKLEQQVCSLELAKKLKELGVKQESFFWWSERTIPATLWSLEAADRNEVWDDPRGDYFSAFTVAELGEMLPKKIEQVRQGGISRTGFWLDISFDQISEKWRYSYANHKANECIEMLFADTEADARGKMLVYLLENHLTQPL